MRPNKASRMNRNFLTVTVVMAVFVLSAVSILWYIAFSNEEAKQKMVEKDKYSVAINGTLLGDSLCVVLNDSVLFNGVVDSCAMVVMEAKGHDNGNMISIADAAGNTINEDLPNEPSVVVVDKDEQGNLVCVVELMSNL